MEFFDLQSEIVAYKNIALGRILASFYEKQKKYFVYVLAWVGFEPRTPSIGPLVPANWAIAASS